MAGSAGLRGRKHKGKGKKVKKGKDEVEDDGEEQETPEKEDTETTGWVDEDEDKHDSKEVKEGETPGGEDDATPGGRKEEEEDEEEEEGEGDTGGGRPDGDVIGSGDGEDGGQGGMGWLAAATHPSEEVKDMRRMLQTMGDELKSMKAELAVHKARGKEKKKGTAWIERLLTEKERQRKDNWAQL